METEVFVKLDHIVDLVYANFIEESMSGRYNWDYWDWKKYKDNIEEILTKKAHELLPGPYTIVCDTEYFNRYRSSGLSLAGAIRYKLDNTDPEKLTMFILRDL